MAEVGAGARDRRVALVTGGARGLGKAIALRYARGGFDVCICDVCRADPTVDYPLATEEELEAARAELLQGGSAAAVACRCDVTRSADVERAVEECSSRLGRPEVVVANAGIFSAGLSWELGEEQWRRVIDVNLTGVWLTWRAAVPAMLANGSGRLIAVASTAGLRPFSRLAHYVAAKHGIIGLTRTMALELGRYGISVNAVCPTQMATRMTVNQSCIDTFVGHEGATKDELDLIMRRLHVLPDTAQVPIDDVAGTAYWLGAEAPRYVTGQAITVDAGATLGAR
jgi:(+)-trans-carveol dehydrogenase